LQLLELEGAKVVSGSKTSDPTIWLDRLATIFRYQRPALVQIATCGGVGVLGVTSHSTHYRSFRRQVFPGSQLHWYWQPKTRKWNNTYARNTKEKQKNYPS